MPIRLALNGHLDGDTSVESALTDFGRALAAHLLCDNAVAINRAAISEARSGPSLAGSLSKSGRAPIHRTFVRYLEQCHERGLLNIEDPNEAVDTFVGLLLSDTQTLRLLGVVDAPCETDIEGRAKRTAASEVRSALPPADTLTRPAQVRFISETKSLRGIVTASGSKSTLISWAAM